MVSLSNQDLHGIYTDSLPNVIPTEAEESDKNIIVEKDIFSYNVFIKEKSLL
jgi:hypothetical protein